MKKHHYVYHSFEEWGRDYIGIRSCDCLPEEDTRYFGSFKDKTFKPTGKNILFVCETREEILKIEIELHDFFDVAVNPKFANKSKATNTKFDRTGVPVTEEAKKKISVANSGENHPCYGRTGENHPQFGFRWTEEQKKAHSERMIGKYTGENSPNYGRTGVLNHNYGRTGALSPISKPVTAIQPDGTERHYGGVREATRKLEIDRRDLCKYLKTGHVPKQGKFKGWQFSYKNSEES